MSATGPACVKSPTFRRPANDRFVEGFLMRAAPWRAPSYAGDGPRWKASQGGSCGVGVRCFYGESRSGAAVLEGVRSMILLTG